MTQKKKHFPPYLQRSLAILIIFLMGVSIARLLVTMHQQEERIEILEGQVAQLLSDTTRLQIAAQPRSYYYGNDGYTGRADRTYRRSRHSHADSHAKDRQPFDSPSDRGVMSDSASSPSSNASPSRASDASVSRPSSDASATAAQHGGSRKFTTPHLFDLNTIDSLTLIRIPGIAARTASVILKNRQRYGGFTSPRQLQEFLTWAAAQDYMDEWCNSWFTADASRLRTLSVNKVSISELQRHPYITYDQAVEITRYRTRHKQITSAAELQQLTTFTPEQLQDLLPYLSFE